MLDGGATASSGSGSASGSGSRQNERHWEFRKCNPRNL